MKQNIMLGVALGLLATAGTAASTETIRFDFSPPFLETSLKQSENDKSPLAVPRCARPPSIDGKVSPDEWAKAVSFDLSHTSPSSHPTKFRIMFDDNAIYIAAECWVPARNGYAIGVAGGPVVQALQSVPENPPARDGKDIWKEDHIEAWFQPPGKDSKKCQFAISDIGGIADLLAVQSKDDFSYNPDWSHAVGRNEYGWTAEMAIPKAALQTANWPAQSKPMVSGVEPVEGPSQIGFNIGRDGPLVKTCSWSGTWGDTSQKIKLEGSGKDEPQSIGVSEYRSAGVSEALSVKAERTYARPGDRWIEISVQCSGFGVQGSAASLETGRLPAVEGPRPESERHEVMAAPKSLENLLLTAEVYATGGGKPVAQSSITPPRVKGKVLVDLRTLNLKEARLVLKLSEGDKEIGAKEINFSARDPEQPLKAGDKIKILIDVPEGITNVVNWPVMIGVPFPAGALWDADQVRLVDQKGKEIPSQKEITGLWAPEGAIKWLRFDALVSSKDGCFMEMVGKGTEAQRHRGTKPEKENVIPDKGNGRADFRSATLDRSSGVAGVKPALPLTLTEQDGKITIDTGVSTYILGKGISPIQEIRLGGKRLASCEKTRGLYVVDQTGRIASASAEEETMKIEASGPVASCVRFEGWYKTEKGENLARHITRVENFAGQPFARVTHTLVLTEDTNKTWFKDIGWEFALDPGANPQALFGVSRTDWQKTYSVPLNTDLSGGSSGVASAKTEAVSAKTDTSTLFMLQDQHYMFAHGTNHFLVAHQSHPSDKSHILKEGEECGDWSALAGAKGGLMMACKEAARQHPKEFEVSSGNASFLGGDGLPMPEHRPGTTGRNVPQAHPPMAGKRDEGVPSPTITLHLFSNRGGDELDFRAPSLVKRWDLAGWFKKTSPTDAAHTPGNIEQVKAYDSNAAGWSKTHELLVTPLAAKTMPDEIANISRLHTQPVYALPEPEWICNSGVMGPLHPCDPQRFPEAEKLIDDTFTLWERRVADWGDFGFVDYFAGPHLSYQGKNAAPMRYSFLHTYTLRPDLWRIYARSGKRRIRQYAEATARTFGDSIIAHWPAAGKIKGLFVVWKSGSKNPNDKASLPFYWEGSPSVEISCSSDLDVFINYYYLAGDRRVRDIVEEYAKGCKQFRGTGSRSIMTLRLCAQAYGITWDPALRDLAEYITDKCIADPEGALGLNKKQADGGAYGSTYKIMSDVAGLLDAWQILGDQRYHDLALQTAWFLWYDYLGQAPVSYCSPQGRIGNFLYQETGDPSCAEMLALAVREAATAQPAGGAESVTFVFQGIPYAEDVVARSGADKAAVASWVTYDDFGGYPVSIVAWKTDQETLEIDLKSSPSADTGTVGGTLLRTVRRSTDAGLNLNVITEKSNGAVTIRVPKDAPAGAYEIQPAGEGFHVAVAHGRVPLVIYAPEYWMPARNPQSWESAPRQAPPVKWYFSVPTNAENAQIFFEGMTKLYAPDGKIWQGGGTNEMLKGWIDLPANKPGLWAMEPVEMKLVRARNLPPFFAARDPNSYFTPEIAWKREAPYKPPEKPAQDTIYVPGAIQTPDNKALYLSGKRTFSFEGGLPQTSGLSTVSAAAEKAEDGTQFLPFKQGTIEFWFKPYWSTFDLPEHAEPVLVSMNDDWKEMWKLNYIKDFRKGNYNQLSYSFYLNTRNIYLYRRTIFTGEEWAHIAWVWGNEETDLDSGKKEKIVRGHIFVNGKRGHTWCWGGNYYGGAPGAYPAYIPKKLRLGNIEAAYDELRVSDIQRYLDDFKPPARDREFTVDEHTRALFHFNGNTEGASFGVTNPIPALIK